VTTSSPTLQTKRRRLGELLISAGVLDEERLKEALGEQKKWGGKLGRTLVEMGFIDEKVMVDVLGQQLHLKTIDLDTAVLPDRIIDFLRLDLAERYGVFPVSADARGKTLHLATSDPTNTENLHQLAFATNFRIVPVVSTGSGIDRAVRRYYFGEVGASRPAPPPLPAPPPSSTPGKGPAAAAPSAPVAPIPPTSTPGHPSYELDQLLGETPPATTASHAAMAHHTHMPSEHDPELSHELTLLREQVDSLEKITASQVRALRSLLEILIESGLISREEYLQKLHRQE
jgi:type IV pilus assembly protein PilB